MDTVIAAYCLVLSLILSSTLSSATTVLQDLQNFHPPPDFNTTINANCLKNPSLRYCTSSPMNLDEIFKFTIVASHLCNESKNPNCVESFPKIDLKNRPNIASLYLSFDFFWKYCPLTILSVDFSNNSIKGSFPNDLLYCTQIHVLDLSLNELSGKFPIQSFSQLTNLTFLNLSYNYFSESKFADSQFFKRFNSSSFLHSGLLLDHKKYAVNAVILFAVFPIIVILLVILLGWLCLQRPDFLPKSLQGKNNRFTAAILKAATDGFSDNNLVGKSDVVEIYRGILRDGTKVRIEIYWDKISRDAYNRFVEECKVFVELRHKNLVRVLGWCKSRRLRAVVTEWTEGENVEMWLLRSVPTWNHRLKVLMEVVGCMRYLQEEWPEVDYELKTSSVLISSNLEPLITRFKLGDPLDGTRKKHKFGVFLLEMIIKRRDQEEFDRDEAGFIKHIRMHHPANLQQLIDERMEVTETTFHQVKQAVSLGLICTDHSSSQQLSLSTIFNAIVRAYKSSLAFPSAHHHRMLQGERNRGHKHVQFT